MVEVIDSMPMMSFNILAATQLIVVLDTCFNIIAATQVISAPDTLKIQVFKFFANSGTMIDWVYY